MIGYNIEIDPKLKFWLKKDVPTSVNVAINRTAKETATAIKTYSARVIKAGKYYSPSPKISDLKKGMYFNTNISETSRLKDMFFNIKYSRNRLNLYRIPYKMKRVIVTKRLGKRLVKVRMNQILTRVYGRSFEVDEKKPFFLVRGGKSGKWDSKYFYKGTPKKSERPISMHRKGSSRKPLAPTLAPSISETVEKTHLFDGIQNFANGAWDKRIKKNLDYYVNLIGG